MKNELSLAIKSARARTGLTQKDIAKRLGITYQTYCKWEVHPERLNVDKLTAIAKVLGISAREFFLEDVLNEIQDG